MRWTEKKMLVCIIQSCVLALDAGVIVITDVDNPRKEVNGVVAEQCHQTCLPWPQTRYKYEQPSQFGYSFQARVLPFPYTATKGGFFVSPPCLHSSCCRQLTMWASSSTARTYNHYCWDGLIVTLAFPASNFHAFNISFPMGFSQWRQRKTFAYLAAVCVLYTQSLTAC